MGMAASYRGHSWTRTNMRRLDTVKEFWSFLRARKKWWLTPIVMFLLVFGVILVFAKGSVIAPFIYSVF